MDFELDEFTKKPEVIFICYDEIIKNPYPFILKQILKKYRKYYEDFLDFSLIENLDDKNLFRFVIQRNERNIFRALAKKEFDFDTALLDIYEKFPDMYFNCETLNMAQSVNMLLTQRFTERIYIYTREYDKRIHLDIQTMYSNMDRVKYVTGDFPEVVQNLNGITTWILNDIIDISALIEFKKTEYTNILILNTGYNYTINENDQLVLRVDPDEITEKYICKLATFNPINLTDEYFTNV